MRANTETDFRIKMAKILEMLGSAFDGERLAAVELAKRELKKRKMTWTELVVPPLLAAPTRAHYARPHRHEPTEGPAPTRKSTSQAAEDERFCMHAFALTQHPLFHSLSPKERGFLVQMCTWNSAVSEKQRSYIEGLAEKLTRKEREKAA